MGSRFVAQVFPELSALGPLAGAVMPGFLRTMFLLFYFLYQIILFFPPSLSPFFPDFSSLTGSPAFQAALNSLLAEDDLEFRMLLPPLSGAETKGM